MHYHHDEEQQLSFYKKLHIKTYRLSKKKDILEILSFYFLCRTEIYYKMLAVNFETTHKPAKPPTNHQQTTDKPPRNQSNDPQITHKPAKLPTNQPQINQKLHSMKTIHMNRNFFLAHPARKEKWVHFLMFLLDFAFRLLHCTILYHP